MAIKIEFGVTIKYQVDGGDAMFLRKYRTDTRHEALISGINELIKMGAQQNFIPLIKTATSERITA
ncbi:MAG: hypothetical protein ACQEXV_22195 [Bacillota bacterium]